MANQTYFNYNNTGVITVDTSKLISDVQQEYIAVFGESLNLDPSTPQGRLIEIEANSRKQILSLNAMIANQININYATGQGLDGLGSLFGRKRKVAISTSVLCYLTGSAGTVIPANSQAKTIAGDVFYTPNNITIDSTGNASAYFYSLVAGEIPCEIMMNALASINYRGFIAFDWNIDWMSDLDELDVIFAHFSQYMEKYQEVLKMKKKLHLIWQRL
jgi:hypothetical protein